MHAQRVDTRPSFPSPSPLRRPGDEARATYIYSRAAAVFASTMANCSGFACSIKNELRISYCYFFYEVGALILPQWSHQRNSGIVFTNRAAPGISASASSTLVATLLRQVQLYIYHHSILGQPEVMSPALHLM